MVTETSSLRTLKIMPSNLNEIVRSWIRSLVWFRTKKISLNCHFLIARVTITKNQEENFQFGWNILPILKVVLLYKCFMNYAIQIMYNVHTYVSYRDVRIFVIHTQYNAIKLLSCNNLNVQHSILKSQQKSELQQQQKKQQR